MAYDDKLAARIRDSLAEVGAIVAEKKMFGGIAFMLGKVMCCGVIGEDMVGRTSADDFDAALAKPHVRPMDFTGRPMKGWIYVGPGATRSAASLRAWTLRCVTFAGTAKPAARKSKRAKSLKRASVR